MHLRVPVGAPVLPANTRFGPKGRLPLRLRRRSAGLEAVQLIQYRFGSAALGAGLLRGSLGAYTAATWISGGLCLLGAVLVLRIKRGHLAVSPAAQAA
ncbi:hypothetical protein [Jeongeupia sp. USM3]|uniref:hypothetical protein n=1 Tax=Jeongeupia sp. USM3 TaxID=1906741 RepID=UPI00089E08C2|nr:hypothetical protein [Jeongeupia sp. USM3]AOX99979.1 hypothetical protein BJP62_05650 [Jeongeupia sp. USM3]